MEVLFSGLSYGKKPFVCHFIILKIQKQICFKPWVLFGIEIDCNEWQELNTPKEKPNRYFIKFGLGYKRFKFYIQKKNN